MGRNKLYMLLSVACLAGYIWLTIAFYMYNTNKENAFSMCMIKNVTGIPCPSCGSTRAVMALLNGGLAESVLLNPFGVIVLSIMVLAPLWILFDLMLNKSSLHLFYNKAETFFRKKYIAVPLIILVLANWIRIICAGL
ncbi:DUF2752 domain-containing protein [Cytophagaceae bacterium ABcell3]|nr:DUF2752 domain-containing protein [Cytophagaceae bacterium ABcell3]